MNELESGMEDILINNAIPYPQDSRPVIIDNSNEYQRDVLSHLKRGLEMADEFLFAVSFIRLSGIEMLLQTFKDMEKRNVKGRIITTDYLAYTEPKAIRKLLSYDFIDVRIITEEAFHVKGYLFSSSITDTVIIGSSNLTGGALKTNREWNVEITSPKGGKAAKDFRKLFEELWKEARPVREIWLTEYEKRYNKEAEIRRKIEGETSREPFRIEPNRMQKEASLALRRLRKEGKRKALLIAATGTGKTYLSAFDVLSFNPEHMLFIVHREQILNDAAESFIDVLGKGIRNDIGFLTGGRKDYDKKYIFSTVQTISKTEVYRNFSPTFFDYIVIDEVHKAAAPSYKRLMEHFSSSFLLGMSATPDRPDRENIYELFDYNIAIDIRLKDALEENMLCPFHYFGISEIKVDGKILTEDASFNDLTSPERVKNIIEKSEYYGFSGKRVKGLIFTSRVEEARKLSEEMNRIRKNGRRMWQTRYVTGETETGKREEYVRRLERDEDDDQALDFIITVDTFNEGIDIPEVNQIIMLRPTTSPIVFIQQLGRGLRKREDKEFLVAIDFIGNYKKSFLIPIALSGDNTYDKDNLRKYITEGSSAIPGCSTIDFDPIARGLIYRNIDSSDLKQLSILKNEYFTLKNRLGRIPTIADFRREKAMDIQNFVDKAGSYHAFVKKVDDDYDVSLTENEEKVLRYVSEKFSDGKRADELLYLKEALSFYNTHENGIFKKEKEAGQRFSSMIANLTLSFPQPTEALKYGKTPLLEIGSDLITPSERLSGCLLNPVFRTLLEDVVNDGLERNREKYGRTYKDTLFTLYEKYTYEDVCRLLLWERNMNANGIGGYFYDKKTKTLPVFINYEKADRAIQYPNTFPDNSNITAYSKMPRRIGSSDYNHIYKTTEEDKDNRIYLFLRKNSKDDRKEFYFLGEIEAIGEAKEVKINGKNAFEIHYHINTPVRQDIFDYITS